MIGLPENEPATSLSRPDAVSDHKKDALPTPKVEDSVVEVGGEQQTEPATNSVTPQGAQATSNPKLCMSTWTPQPEKREGPYRVVAVSEGAFGVAGPTFPIAMGCDDPDTAVFGAANLNAAWLDGRAAQPEGDERLTEDLQEHIEATREKLSELVPVLEKEQHWYPHHKTTEAVEILKHLAAALGSGEGGKDA